MRHVRGPDYASGRRRFLRNTGLAFLAGAIPLPGFPGTGNFAWETLDEALELLSGARPSGEGLVLKLPPVVEDGRSIPLEVGMEAFADTGAGDCSIHLFAPENPKSSIASFRFRAPLARAEIATRIRLQQSQAVIALAQKGDGTWLVDERPVRVAVGGCLSPPAPVPEQDWMRTRVRVPPRLAPGETGEVVTLILHPMESGLRADEDGRAVPRRMIHRFQARFAGEQPFLEAELHTGIAVNPYLRFRFLAPDSGDLELSWIEDGGASVVVRNRIEVG